MASKWLSLEQAAEHINLGKTAVYALAREGRIPGAKVGKKWIFEQTALDSWVRAQHPLDTFFLNLDFEIDNNADLREPQRDGYLRTIEFFGQGGNKAMIQIPVGCGKTGLAALLPLGLAAGRVLVIAPNLTIKDGLFDAMNVSNRQKCFWRKTRVLAKEQMAVGPLVCTLDTGNISIAEKCHVVITNVHQLATNVDKWLMQFSDNFFDMIIVDEAHHSTASSWQKVIERFPNAKIIHLTATPFRSDRQKIDGELVYRYSFRSATLKGYIKRLKASYVAPSEIEIGFRDERGRIYNLEEVQALKAEQWFSRGVALSRPCNAHIVDSSLEKLEELRQSGTRHQLIAVACSINHAREIRSLYRERGFNADVIHSNQSEEEVKSVKNALLNGTLDCIVQVQMLGEGFDHPKLSVAAIFRPFRSLAPYVQFVGRIMRVVVQNNPAHPDNVGHIVTHLGMDLDERLKEFKQFEDDDQVFWDKVVGGAEPEIPPSVSEGSERLTANEQIVVHDEIVDSLWEEDFVSLEDRQMIEDIRDRLALFGLDPDVADALIQNAKKSALRKKDPAEPFLIQPQREWEEARKRLNEQGQRLAKILLNNVGLSMTGTELTYKYKSLNLTGRNNYVSALMMVNRAVNEQLGVDRSQAATEDFKRVSRALDDLLQPLVRQILNVKSEYAENA